MSVEEQKLRHCPFCGPKTGKPVVMRVMTGPAGLWIAEKVKCETCGMQTDNMNDAVSFWNALETPRQIHETILGIPERQYNMLRDAIEKRDHVSIMNGSDPSEVIDIVGQIKSFKKDPET